MCVSVQGKVSLGGLGFGAGTRARRRMKGEERGTGGQMGVGLQGMIGVLYMGL